MPQGPMLTFQSSAFPVVKGEDDETNPGIYGRSLAEWLSKRKVASSTASSEGTSRLRP